MPTTIGTILNAVRLEKGVYKVSDSRVSLDSIVREFNAGADAAQIQSSFDSLSLAQVHAAIAYYLHNRAQVDEYLERRQEDSDRLRDEYSTPELRTQLLARRGKPSEEWEPLNF